MKILFTGASSFTGCWIVPALARAGHDVTVTFTRLSLAAYEGLRRKRVERVLPFARAVWGVESGDEHFMALVRDEGPWDLLCLHGAEVGDYKSRAFDCQRAVAKNIRGFSEMFAAFRSAGGRAVMLTGSYFEAYEGNPNGSSEAASPYGHSKTLTWHACRHECLRAGLTLGKFVIPNPVGPLEEPKLVASLVRDWQSGAVPRLRTPRDICDHVPIPLLAAEYVDFASTVDRASPQSHVFCRPSGWVETVENFSRRVGREFGRLSGREFTVAAGSEDLASKITVRRNSARETFSVASDFQAQFWGEWHQFYFPATEVNERLNQDVAAPAFVA